jgi:hypothetical protein
MRLRSSEAGSVPSSNNREVIGSDGGVLTPTVNDVLPHPQFALQVVYVRRIKRVHGGLLASAPLTAYRNR